MSGALPAGTLEVSFDPLSDTTPAWTDISAYLVSADWSEGKADDLAEPGKGSATFVLDNSDGRFTPEFATGAYYPPGPRPLQRLRFNVDDGTTSQDQGVYYVVDWGNTFQQGSHQEVTVQAETLALILERWKLAALDPPDATAYAEVVQHDGPLWYAHLSDPVGTRVAPVVGNEGVYKNLPTLGQPGLIVGSADKSATFDVDDYARIALDTNQIKDGDAATLEAWVSPGAAGARSVILAGPRRADSSQILQLFAEEGATFDFFIRLGTTGGFQLTSTTVPTAGTVYHVVGTWDGDTGRIYVDGVEEDSASAGGELSQPAANPFMTVGDDASSAGIGPWRIQEAAVYEVALSADRVLAHHVAGSERGFGAEQAGERITSIVTSGLWAETEIQTGTHEVTASMQTGQTRWEEVLRAVKAEMPISLFYSDGDGNPVYLGWDYKSQARSNTVQATFGDSGSEIPYEAIEVEYDEQVYNTVTVSREGGTAQTVTDSASVSEFFESAYDVTGLSHTDDMGCLLIAEEILAEFKQPRNRAASITVAGIHAGARQQILTRQIGDMIAVKRRPHDSNPALDIVTHIIGTEKHMDKATGALSCTYHLARGFGAADGEWKLGLDGYSELGETAILA